jgi:hypothetical protein
VAPPLAPPVESALFQQFKLKYYIMLLTRFALSLKLRRYTVTMQAELWLRRDPTSAAARQAGCDNLKPVRKAPDFIF